MIEEELKIKKLELEISELAKPSWKKPQYITTIVSVLTVLVTATIGFDRYFENVDQNHIQTIENLERTIMENKEQQHKSEISRVEYEIKMLEIAKENSKEQNLILEKKIKESSTELQIAQSKLNVMESKLNKYSETLDKVFATIVKYEKYSPNFARGVIDSPSGQNKIDEIIAISDNSTQRKEIASFAFNITNQANSRSSEKIREELSIE